MSMADDLTGALKELEREQGDNTLVFQGHAVPVVSSMPSEEVIISGDGNELRIETVLYARRSEWLTWGERSVTFGNETIPMGDAFTAPGHGHLVRYPGADGRKLRLVRLRASPDGSHLQLHLTAPASSR